MTESEIESNIRLLKSRIEPAVSFMSMQLEVLEPGYARVYIKIKPEHLNFHGRAFGGIIMSLADHAFGYATNSLSYPSVAGQFNIHFLESAVEGDVLTAECRVVKSGKRVSVSEVKVTGKEGKLIALATGTTLAVGPGSEPGRR